MTQRRWQPGDDLMLDGIRYRVTNGRKGPTDLKLEMRAPDLWLPAPMSAGFVLADFFHENEDGLYPPPRYEGGDMFLAWCALAALHGWRRPFNKLEQARATRHREELR
jgi:hypothetical protein